MARSYHNGFATISALPFMADANGSMTVDHAINVGSSFPSES